MTPIELRDMMVTAAEIAIERYIAVSNPTLCDVTQNSLYREFSRAWVNKQIATGKKASASYRRGNRKMYDRSAFAAQWLTERRLAGIIGKYADLNLIK